MTQTLHIVDAPANSGTVRAIAAEARVLAKAHLRRHRIVSLDPSPGAPPDADAVDWVGGCDADRVLAEIASADVIHLHYWNTPALNALLRRVWPPCRLMASVYAEGAEAPHAVTHALTGFADFLLLRGGAVLPAPLAAWPANRRQGKCAAVPPAPLAPLPRAARKPEGPVAIVHAEAAELTDSHQRFAAMAGALARPGVVLASTAGGGPIGEGLPVELVAGGIEEAIARADILVCFGEESPRSWNPALLRSSAAAGVPVVLVGAPGLGQGVTDNITGFVVDDEAAAAAAVSYLLDAGVRATLGEQARTAALLGFSGRTTAEDIEAACRYVMKLPRRVRHWGQDDPASAPIRSIGTADLLAAPHGAYAALEFVRSLGTGAGAFAVSLLSTRYEEAAEADAEIESATAPRAAELERAVDAYSRAYPLDPFLHFWRGLFLLRRDRHEEALAAFDRAEQTGMVHWRLALRQGQTAFRLGRAAEAKRHLGRVLWFKPDFVPALALMQALSPAAGGAA